MPGGLMTPSSGRVNHSEKITVYISSEELVSLESTRLMLRARHGIVVDRGHLVREAIRLSLADFAANGEQSALVKGLSS